MTTTLTPFENHQVVGTSIVLKKAGDGLSAALKIEPDEYEHGETVFLVVETRCSKVGYITSKDDPEKLIRVHDLDTVVATPVEGKKVQGIITQHRKRLKEAEGQGELPGLDEPDDDTAGTGE